MDEFNNVAQGSELAIGVTLRNDLGVPITTFTGSEPLLAQVWAGGTQPVLFAPTATWANAPLALVTITCSPIQTQGLDTARYLGRLLVYAGQANQQDAYEWSMTIPPSPGTTAALPIYVGYAKCRELAPWIDACFDPERHLSGFLRERATARQIFDRTILRMWRGNSAGRLGSHDESAFAWAGGGRRRTPLPSILMTQYLAANFLIVDDKVERINAYLAIAEIGRQQIGRNNVYAAYGQYYEELADDEISRCTAAVDIGLTGTPQLAVPLGVTNTMYT